MDIKLVRCSKCKNILSNARLNVFFTNNDQGKLDPLIKLIITLGYTYNPYSVVSNTSQIIKDLRINLGDNYEILKKVLISEIGKQHIQYANNFVDLCVFCCSPVSLTTNRELNESFEKVRAINTNIYQKYFKVPFDFYYSNDNKDIEPLEVAYCSKNNLFQDGPYKLSHLDLLYMYNKFWRLDLTSLSTEELFVFNSYANLK